MGNYIHIGPYGKCQDCDRTIFIRSASLIEEVAEPWTIRPALLRDVGESTLLNYKVPKRNTSNHGFSARYLCCSRCDRRVEQGAYWLDQPHEKLLGPLCARCVWIIFRKISIKKGYNFYCGLYTVAVGEGPVYGTKQPIVCCKNPNDYHKLITKDEVELF